MIFRLLTLAAVIGVAEQGYVFNNCDCPPVETFSQTTVLYCPTASVQSCNSSIIIEDSCTLSCPGNGRTSLAYRNGTTVFSFTTSIKCEGGNLTNAAGVRIAPTMSRPTCGTKATCSACPLAFEATKCPTNSTCNVDNFVRYIETDGCERVKCANQAKLTLYDDAKNVITNYTSTQLFCAVNNKWFNYSYDGQITNGVSVNQNFTANCVLPQACETCNAPNFVTNPATQIPPSFRTGYKTINPTVTRRAGQCATSTCPNGYVLMGFTSGTNDTQTGTEFLNQQYMKCDATGFWRNGDLAFTPQTLYTICMQKISPCPAPDLTLNSGYNVTCDTVTKQYSLTCPGTQKLTMRYNNESAMIKYDKATFFEGKGWLAYACDATAALFTTIGGRQITIICA